MGYKLYKDSSLIKKIYVDNKSIKKVYQDGKVIWAADPYEPGTLLFYQTGPNTYSGILPQGVYSLIICGAGGNDIRWNYLGVYFHNHGGSGATWEGIFYNPVDQQATFYAGGIQDGPGQDSYMDLSGNRMITAGGGQKSTGTVSGTVSGNAAPGGSVWVNGSLRVVSTSRVQNGNTGGRGVHNADPTPSVCSINNWGRGGGEPIPDQNQAIAGGVRLEYLRMDP